MCDGRPPGRARAVISLRSDLPLTIFLPSLGGGGAERSIASIASGLAARGAAVTLILCKADGPFLSEVNSCVRIIDLRAASAPRALPGLVRHLRNSPPVTLLSAMSHANVVAAMAHRISGSSARLVFSEHSHLSSSLAEYRGLRMQIARAMMPGTYRRADRIVAVSCGVADDLLRHLPLDRERVVTIYNPVVTERLFRMSEETPSHPWFAGSIPVVLATGRLIPLKDFSTLIDAFAKLRRKRPMRLLILGEGSLRSALLAQAARLGLAEDVSLPGFDANPFAAMRAASVFVLSSRYEGLANVLIEAMACGARVVSTDCPGGPSEIIEGGRWGALVPVGNSDAMAAAIADALDDPTPPDVRRRAMAFTEEASVNRYAEVLGLLPVATRHA
jgi:glycosyltransferase involved in cell wall biosynthesis